MKEIVRKHIEDELYCLRNNRESVKEIATMIREEQYSPTREYLVLVKRIGRIQGVIVNGGDEVKKIYVLRYQKKLSWVAIAFAMSVSEATAKRYNRRLLEDVGKALGWL